MAIAHQQFNPIVHDVNQTRVALQRIRAWLESLTPHVASVPPTAADDSSRNHIQGGVWVDDEHHIAYRATSVSPGAAVWQEIEGTNATAGSGGVAGGGDLDGTVDYVGVHDVSLGLNKRVVLNDLVAAGGGATDSAKYIIQEAIAGLGAAQSLGDLQTGLLKNTVSGGVGVLSKAALNTDYSVTRHETHISRLAPGVVIPG